MIGITLQCGATVLADGTDSGGQVVGDIRVNGRRLIEVVPCIRAIEVFIRGHGNLSNTVNVTIDREYATLLEARLAQFSVGEVVEERADMVLTFTDGSDQIIVELPNAGWESFTPRYGGRSLETDFQILGGKFRVSSGIAPSVDLIDGGLEGSGFSFDDDIDGGHAGDSAGCFVETIAGGTPN